MPRTDLMQLFSTRTRPLNVCAPMVRYSKLPFRELVRRYNTDIVYTPMILANVFSASNFARDCEFSTNRQDDPVVIQFAASNGVDLANAAELAAPFVSGIDINCGCPQKWAIHEKLGSHLMSDPETVRDMIRMTKARVNVPCSIKIRIHKDLRETEEFVKRALSVGVDFITVHGRTKKMKSTEPVSLEGMKFVKEVSTVPVLANGDVFTMEDANRIVAATGVDGTMSARGILENPALYAGYEITPWECIEDYVDLALSYGTNAFIFHHHLMYMFERTMSNAERRTFNSLSSVPSIVDYLEENYGLDISKKRGERAIRASVL
ncbi:tRNA-dihydrouridine synthase 4 [Entomortierella parvispora]|uniref:tRNA-dihydrouridine synthase n=1 Tax=Entomortierella parvispora TaxID=205924 RepID=A0A9P3H197_9FUNG|nr:tRNA-dihydrouridine synthase 4 [Entomortierella parvispora]